MIIRKEGEVLRYTINEIREKIEEIAQKYQIQQIILFGSYAKGTATEESDVDFVVNYGENCRGLKCIEFQLDLEDVLSKEVDVVNIKQVPYYLTRDILKEGLIIYDVERTRDEIDRRNHRILQRYTEITRAV